MEALSLNNWKLGGSMNISGEIRYKPAFQGKTVCLYFYAFLKTVNLIEFEMPIDTEGSCPVSS